MNCKSCEISIPEGQQFCSMCYGDPAYGRDGYYQQEQEHQHEQEHRQGARP